jgi:hypothetical protein
MKFEKIYVRGVSKFSDLITQWASDKTGEIISISDKFQEHFIEMDSLLIFNENQYLSKEVLDVKIFFDKQQKAIHKIDINGTLMVGLLNLALWIESVKAKQVFIIGSDELLQNPNLERYLNVLK